MVTQIEQRANSLDERECKYRLERAENIIVYKPQSDYVATAWGDLDISLVRYTVIFGVIDKQAERDEMV